MRGLDLVLGIFVIIPKEEHVKVRAMTEDSSGSGAEGLEVEGLRQTSR